MSTNESHTVSPSTEHALLGFLLEGPRHGYAIYRELLEESGLWLVWRMKQSQLYALLSRLEDRGLLTSFKGKAEAGRPPRKMYELTAAGRDAYEIWLHSPVAHGRDFRLDLLVKLFFAQQEGHTVLEQLLQSQEEICGNWLLEARALETEERDPYRRLVHRYRAGQIRAMLDWIADCRAAFVTSPTSR